MFNETIILLLQLQVKEAFMSASRPKKSGCAIVSAGESHDSAITALAEDAGMGTLSNRGESFVAIDDEGDVAGFVRIVESGGEHYVCPIVVAQESQGHGVGVALMTYAHERFGTLRFVARGAAVPFYESLGCRQTSWSDIAFDISSDCVDCPDRAGCAPQPMVWE